MILNAEIEEMKGIKKRIEEEKKSLSHLMNKWNEVLTGRKLPLNQHRLIFRATAQARILCRSHICALEKSIEAFLDAPKRELYEAIVQDWVHILKQLKSVHVNISQLKEFDEEEEKRSIEEKNVNELGWQKVTSDRQKKKEEKIEWLRLNDLPPDLAISSSSDSEPDFDPQNAIDAL